ncbi:MAG: DUF3786 domain-containing protein [Clostridia bacterium]|nr:DUF3786 domain-containing protein [Clostridia bacterium]
MGSNYIRMRDASRALFMEYDQEEIIRRWDLRHDEAYLYADFMGQALKIDRRTAEVSHVAAPAPGEYVCGDFINESMALFDLLTRSPARPRALGQWSSIGTLGGIIGAGHDRTLSNEPTAELFRGRTEALARACERLNGVPAGKADVGYAIPVFRDFQILFQFWDGDDEFPASIKYLFDANALQFMHYETLWYVMNCLSERLKHYAKRQDGPA